MCSIRRRPVIRDFPSTNRGHERCARFPGWEALIRIGMSCFAAMTHRTLVFWKNHPPVHDSSRIFYVYDVMTAFRADLSPQNGCICMVSQNFLQFYPIWKSRKDHQKRGEFHNWPLREFFEKEIYRMKRERRSKPPWVPCSFQSSRWR